MSYATVNDLVERFGEVEIADLAHPDTDINTSEKIARSLEDAGFVIDSYLRTRHVVPITPVPGVLVGACCDIARFNLYDDGVPESVQERYESTLKWLKDIGAGRASLGQDDDSVAPVGRVTRRSGNSGFDWDRHVL